MNKQINNAFGKLVEKLSSWLDTGILMIPNLIIAVIVIIIFSFIGWMVKRIVPRALGRFSKNIALNKLMGTISSMILVVTGLFLALGIMNLDKTVTSLLAGVGVMGIALGFAFQNSAANFISGIIMAMPYPLNVGDIIETNGVFGRVERISIRYLVMVTPQGQKVSIPNRKVLEEVLKNYTLSGERRIDLECGISYGDELDKVERIALETIKQIEGINKNKELEFFYTGFGDSSINFVIRYWILYSRQPDFFKARSEGVKQLKKAFNENDITIPFPIRTLDFGIKGGKSLSKEMNNKLVVNDHSSS